MLCPAARLGSFKTLLRCEKRLLCRSLVTLAIETSCDDTAVAVLETRSCSTNRTRERIATSAPLFPASLSAENESNEAAWTTGVKARLWFNEKITANNARYGGIHPIVALESHQRNLASLVQKAVDVLKRASSESTALEQPFTPDLIAVTRGPGMRSNLATGIDLAKGLSVAWEVPIIGVHHMQAHLLTPRLVAALNKPATLDRQEEPDFPFLSLLVSGGHTMLLLSRSLSDHELLADTDLAVGQALDKIARLVLPQDVLDTADSTMYGAVLETFAFSQRPYDPKYEPPPNRGAGYHSRNKNADNEWPWSIGVPLAKADGGTKRHSLEYSFTGIVSSVERIMKFDQSAGAATRTPRTEQVTQEERRALAAEAMRVCFEHLASRVLLALDGLDMAITTVVVSGGVASNHYLREILGSWLSEFNYPGVGVICPPPKYCTDNAAMIAWAGAEMYEAGWRSDLGFTARRRWALGGSVSSHSPVNARGQGEDDAIGILGVDNWYNVKDEQTNATWEPQPRAGSLP